MKHKNSCGALTTNYLNAIKNYSKNTKPSNNKTKNYNLNFRKIIKIYNLCANWFSWLIRTTKICKENVIICKET